MRRLRRFLGFVLRYGVAFCVGWMANLVMALWGNKGMASLRVPADGTVRGSFYTGAGEVD